MRIVSTLGGDNAHPNNALQGRLASLPISPGTPQRRLVYLVDDDPSVRQGLEPHIRAQDCELTSFGSAEAFLAAPRHDGPSCVLAEMFLPGKSGLELQEILMRQDPRMPVVFLADRADIATAVRAMKAGAIDFLTKPAPPAAVVASITLALQSAVDRWEAHRRRSLVHERFALLTPREQQVLEHVLAGRRNKQIAAALSSEEATVKVHRYRLMRKLGMRTLADLLAFAMQHPATRAQPHESADRLRSPHTAPRIQGASRPLAI